VCTLTCAGASPVTCATMAWCGPGACVGDQISASPALTHAVQFIGSMHACARYGTSYTASIVFAAGALTSPSFRATLPGRVVASASDFEIVSDESPPRARHPT